VGPRGKGVGLSQLFHVSRDSASAILLVSIEYLILRSSTFLACTGRTHLSAGCTDKVELQNEVNKNYTVGVCPEE
jgi:hypothetical protein